MSGPISPKGRMVWPQVFGGDGAEHLSPSGRRPTQPEMQELPRGGSVKGGGGLAGESTGLGEADYSAVERRVLVVMHAHSYGKEALLKMRDHEAQIAKAFGVPHDMLGEERRFWALEESAVLDPDEMQVLMSEAPIYNTPSKVKKGKNPFAPHTIKRYTK